MISMICSSANELWGKAFFHVKKYGNTVNSRLGENHECTNFLFQLTNPKERWIYDRCPQMSIAYSIAELIWILKGSDDANVINYWNPALPKYAGDNEKYHGAYGKRIRYNFGFDQLKKAYNVLLNNQESRQAVILIWDPQKDFPHDDGSSTSLDTPCNICSLLKIKNKKLIWTQIMRSNDLFRGLPYNIVQFTGLQEIMAGWLGLEVGNYTHYSDSLHIYSTDIKTIAFGGNEHMMNNDKLNLSYTDTNIVIDSIFSKMKYIAGNNICEKELIEMFVLPVTSQAYSNFLSIILLYAANKQGFQTASGFFLTECKNEVYKKIWIEWVGNRKGVKYE